MKTTSSVPKQRVVIAHAKRCQNSSDPVGQTNALGDESAPFANAPSGILIDFVGNRHHRAHARLASQLLAADRCPESLTQPRQRLCKVNFSGNGSVNDMIWT